MKSAYLALIFLLTGLSSAVAQMEDSFTIKLNKEVLLRSPVESDEPIVFIDKAAVKENKFIIIEYKTTRPEENWNRTFYLNDENEKSYQTIAINKQSGTVRIAASKLAKAASSGVPLYLHTASLPNDKELAALVRVRRITLCKIMWK